MDKGYIVFWDEQGDSDILCFFCYAVAGEVGELYLSDQDETDNPLHCSQCHRPINYRLTNEGIGYVIDAIIESLLNWDISPISKEVLPWYENCPRTEVVRDWAKDLLWYSLDDHETELVDYYLGSVPDTLLHS